MALKAFQLMEIWWKAIMSDLKIENEYFTNPTIGLDEKLKIISLSVFWQTENGTIHFDMSPDSIRICLPTSVFLS